MLVNIDFETLKANCRNQGAFINGVASCCFKDGKKAHTWADWQPCKRCNCYLINNNKRQQMAVNDKQQNIFELIGG